MESVIRRTIACATAFLVFVAATADDGATWRKMMRSLVKAGNKQYERSYRRGILLYADSIKAELPNCLTNKDSLEFTADYLKLMGDYHYENSNYDESSYAIADECYRQALAIYDGNRIFNGHLDRAPMMHRELAQLYYKQGRYAEAKAEMVQACGAYKLALERAKVDTCDYLDLCTFRAMCEARLGEDSSLLMDSVLTYYKKEHKDQDTREGQEKYYEALRKKGKITLLAGGSGTDALAYYKDYFTWRRNDALATLATMTAEEREDYWMRMRPFVADAYQTEDADAAFLYDITLFAKGLLLQIERLSGRGKSSAEALASLSYTWKDVQRRLRKNECAVEFIQYEKDGRQLMAALVLHSSGKPQWVAYCAPDDILSYNCNGQTCRKRLSTTNGYRKNDLYNDSTLCSMLWSDELLAAVKGCTKIFFAPDGYLHQIAIEYMFPTQSAAITQPKLYRLTSTRRLMERDTAKNNGSQAALLVGGVNYDYNNESEAADNNLALATTNDTIARNFIRGLNARFSYLKGTKKEIDSIYAARSCSADTLLTGSTATEATFRSLCSGYPVVAVATHGYFGAAQVPMGTDLKPCYTDESLSQSVIALAGCNASLSAATTDDGNEYDGLLSAREISRCDMSRTRLAIISACQTGLGYITADGVYGMQRGLKNAGVESMIVSLWNVSDEATSLLMTTFHKCLGQGMTTNDAFNAARQSLVATAQTDSATTTTTKFRFNAAKLINEKVSMTTKSADYSSPQFTNAFILIDAIE